MAIDKSARTAALRWPKDNQSALIKFYGDPGTGAVADQLTKITPPFKMYYDGKLVNTLSFHKKAAPALLGALNKIWDYYDHDQAQIDRHEISKYSGTYNHRYVRGTEKTTKKWSNHAYGAAIDLDSEDNGLGAGRGDLPYPVIAAFKSEGFSWGGDYKGGRTDPMHFELCDRGEPARTFDQWLAFYKVKPKKVAAAQTFVPEEIEQDFAEPEISDQAKEPAVPVPADSAVRGDPELWNVQRRLKAMNYNPGGIDGVWGGMTAGAIIGFINDRKLPIEPPTSFVTFQVIQEPLKKALAAAEAEPFKRPIAPERANATSAKVEAIAPEVIPVKRNYLAAVWASVVTFFTAVINSVRDYIAQAWGFFTENKDSLPSDSGFFSTVWDYVLKVPATAWLLMAGCGLAFVAYNSLQGINKITESIKTGERQ